MNPNDPVYPIHNPEGLPYVPYPPTAGLTKREYFAGLAMQGLIANDCGDWEEEENPIEEMAMYSVEYADALLAELNKPVTP